jgi:hypothetical protein
MRHSKSRFPKPPTPPQVDREIMLGEVPKRMQHTMDVSRETVLDSPPSKLSKQSNAILLHEWVEWCRSTGREAHAADLIERTRAELRNQ